MPRSLKLIVSCDNCGAPINDEHHEGSLVMKINDLGLRQVDLCLGCMNGDATVNSLIKAYIEADDIPQPKKVKRQGQNQGTPASCPACEHVAGSAQGLGRHSHSVHGMTLAKLRQQDAFTLEKMRKVTADG